ncbi:MAG: DegV family protein [Clostridia bacterium]|nr:DegV family protein [Clostridia bacterium]MBP3422597.1 DegV family protein [Clostridia bacterium]
MIKILIDSASDISKAEAQKMGITMLPMLISFGAEEYLDGDTLLPEEFYEKLVESDTMPKTSQITPYRFEEALEELTKQGDEVIIITISSKLSGTYAAAVQAAEKFQGVRVVDSMNACIGERLLCQYALRLIEGGHGLDETVNELEKAKGKIRVIAMLGTLEYLKRGGRISSAVAFAGELLALKPVVAVIDGEVKLIGKAMGSKAGNNLLNRLVKEKGIDFSMPIGVVWSGMNDAVLQKYVKDSGALWEGQIDKLPAYVLGATIGAHIGPGAIGVAFFEK